MTGIRALLAAGLIIVIPTHIRVICLPYAACPELISMDFLLHNRPLSWPRGEWEGLRVRGREGTNWISHAQEVTKTESHQSVAGACLWKPGRDFSGLGEGKERWSVCSCRICRDQALLCPSWPLEEPGARSAGGGDLPAAILCFPALYGALALLFRRPVYRAPGLWGHVRC